LTNKPRVVLVKSLENGLEHLFVELLLTPNFDKYVLEDVFGFDIIQLAWAILIILFKYLLCQPLDRLFFLRSELSSFPLPLCNFILVWLFLLLLTEQFLELFPNGFVEVCVKLIFAVLSPRITFLAHFGDFCDFWLPFLNLLCQVLDCV